VTLERLERRRGETWRGLWLAPLGAVIAQALLLGVIGSGQIGWLARTAVLAAALATSLAGAWSALRAHAREVQYSEAIAELTSDSDGEHPDLRPFTLPRPQRRRPVKEEIAADEDDAAEAETTVATPEGEDETTVIDVSAPPANAAAAGISMPSPSAGRIADGDGPEGWVARWDRHLVWWASGDAHAKTYMAWTATLALFALADVAVYLGAL
jgi:hypothetical protein